MPEESKEGCSRKPHLTEAQRTNRFDPNSSHNSAFSNLTPCNHLESTNRGDEYKTQEKDDVPCINIILKPVLDHKTEHKDTGIQIVEITAVTENINNRSINSANTSSKETKKVETKCVKVQTEVEKNIQDSGTQTTEELTDRKNIGQHVPKQEIPEADTNERNRSVQFRDNRVTDNVGGLNRNLSNAGDPNAQSLPHDDFLCDKDAIETVNIDDSTSTYISDDHRRRTIGLDTSVAPVDCCDSMKTLYKSANSHDKSNGASNLKSRVEKTPVKLSDRIKSNIDKLETGSCVSTQSSMQTTNTSNGIGQELIRTKTKLLPCSDTCKDFASQAKLLQTHSNRSETTLENSSIATRDTSTLPSVLSNNPPIPKILIDTTDTMEWESPTRNKTSEVTIGTTVSDSCFPSTIDTTPCCSNQNLNVEGASRKNVTMDEGYSDNERIKAWGNIGQKSRRKKTNIENLNSGTDTRGFWDNESETFSKSGIDKNSAVRTTNTLDGEKTLDSKGLSLISNNRADNSFQHSATTGSTMFGGTPDFESSRPNAGNLLTTSDLTRPEFIRMLTEIKEHTCGLEMQLFAMNEALKRKQATRSKVLSSTLKNYDSRRKDHPAQEPRNKMIEANEEPSSCGSEFLSVEHARLAPEEFNEENLSRNSCCAISDDGSTSENKQLENETGNNETCGSNISISKRKPKKPVFKTRRSCLWTPLRQSDYRMGKYKLHKLTPNEKSMLDPKELSPSSPQLLITASSSLKNCCEEPELLKAGSLSPIQKPEKSEVTARCTHSTTSNPSVNRMLVEAALTSSSPKKSSKAKAVAKMDGNRDPKTQKGFQRPLKTTADKVINETIVSTCNLDTPKNSDSREKYCQGGKMEPQQVRENVSTSSSILKKFKVSQRSGLFQCGAKEGPKSSSGRESSFCESSSNVSPKNLHTQNNDTKTPPSRLKMFGAIPRLKLLPIRSQNQSQTHEEKKDHDSACHDAVKNGKDHSDCTIKTEQNTPFSVNNINNCDDSEEEVNSTDYYGSNKSANRCYPKESKGDANSRKRKRGHKLTKQDFSSPLNTSGQVQYNCKKNSQTINSDQNTLGKFNQNNLQHKDSKCTICVTVSLDDTPSSEEVKRI